MNFQQAQDWIFPWEEVNCPATGQNSFACLQARTVFMAVNYVQLTELYQDRQTPQAPMFHPKDAHSKVHGGQKGGQNCEVWEGRGLRTRQWYTVR